MDRSFESLYSLGFITAPNDGSTLTDTGRFASGLGVDLQLGRMVRGAEEASPACYGVGIVRYGVSMLELDCVSTVILFLDHFALPLQQRADSSMTVESSNTCV